LAQIQSELPLNTDIEIWWQDEARVGQKTKLTRRWAPCGSLPSAPKDQRTESAYIFGAICPKRGVGAGFVLPRCNTQAMQWHLEKVSSQVTLGAHAVLSPANSISARSKPLAHCALPCQAAAKLTTRAYYVLTGII
jgi:hypothetical protein